MFAYIYIYISKSLLTYMYIYVYMKIEALSIQTLFIEPRESDKPFIVPHPVIFALNANHKLLQTLESPRA